MAFVVGRLVAALTADASSFNRALDAAKGRGDATARNIARNWRRIGGDLKNFGSELTQTVTLPLAAVAFGATRAAITFERAFADVRKNVDDTGAGLEELSGDLRKLALGKPVKLNELTQIAALAGQLGIKRKNIIDFTATIADLRATTNLTGEEGATSLAKILTVMEVAQEDTRKLGSALFALGKDSNATEQEILGFALQVAGAGKVVGVTAPEVLGLSTAFASVGLEAEAGGTAISRTLIEMASAAAKGGPQLAKFAQVAGRPIAEFARMVREEPAQAMRVFIDGLRRLSDAGGNVFETLDKLGLGEIRVRRALLSAAAASGIVGRSLDLSNSAWQQNTSLTKGAAEINKTAASQLQIAANAINDAGINLGRELAPILVETSKVAVGAARAFGNMPQPLQRAAIAGGLLAGVLGPLSFAGGSIARIYGRIAPVMRTVWSSVTGLAAGSALLTSSLTAAGAAAGAVTGGLVLAAGALGVGLGTAIRKTANEVMGLGYIMGLFAEKNRELEGEPERFAATLVQYKLLRKQLGLLGEEWDVAAEATDNNARRLSYLTDKALALARARNKEAVATRAAAEAARAHTGPKGGGPPPPPVRDEDQDREIKRIVGALEEERSGLTETRQATVLKAAALAGATTAETAYLRQLLQGNEALRQRGERETEVRGILEAVAEQNAQLLESEDLRIVAEARRAGATTGEVAYLEALLAQNAALEKRHELEDRAAEIREGIRSDDERTAKAVEEVNALYEAGLLTIIEYNEAIRQLTTSEQEFAARATRDLTLLEVTGVAAADGMQSAFRVAFFDPMNTSFREMGEAFSETFRRMLADAVSQLVSTPIRSFFANLFGAAGPIIPGSGGAGGGGASIGGTLQHGGPVPMTGAMGLHSGEFVLNRAAVDRLGLSNVAAMNAGAPLGGAGDTYNVYNNIDARGAGPGVAAQIERVLITREDVIVDRAAAKVASLVDRGGAYAGRFRR